MSENPRRLPRVRNDRLPEIELLFFVEFTTPDHKSQNATCKGCGVKITNVKLGRMITHASKCMESNRLVVEALELKTEALKLASLEKSIDEGKKISVAQTKARVDGLLGRFVASAHLSVSVVNSPSFKEFIGALEPGYKLPSRRELTYKILPAIASACNSATIKKFQAAPAYTVTAEFDGWTSRGHSILAIVFTAHDGQSMLVDLIDVSHVQHGAELLANMAVAAMRNSGLAKEKFNAIISDQASNCRKARKYIVEKFPSNHLIEHRCMAHLFNLIGGLMSKCGVIKENLNCLMVLIKVVGRCKILSTRLKAEGANKLTNTVPTRWYSVAGAINSALRAREAFRQIPCATPTQRAMYNHSTWSHIVEDDGFWRTLEGSKIYFDRLAAMIGRAEARSSLLSDSLRDLLEFGQFIKSQSAADTHREIAIRAFVTHFNNLATEPSQQGSIATNLNLLLAAYLLNPNYGTEFLTIKAKNLAREYILRTLFNVSNDKSAATAMMGELKRYLAVLLTVNEPVKDVYGWWSKQLQFPVLGGVARRLAALHSSSANTERLFSTLTNIATAKRSCISSSTLFDLASINLFENSRGLQSQPSPANQLELSSQLSAGSSQVRVQDGQTGDEGDNFISEELPGSYLFDPDILEEAGSTTMSTDFYSGEEFSFFKSLIDYNLVVNRTSPAQQEERESRRDSDELARQFLSSYCSEDDDE